MAPVSTYLVFPGQDSSFEAKATSFCWFVEIQRLVVVEEEEEEEVFQWNREVGSDAVSFRVTTNIGGVFDFALSSKSTFN